MAGCGSDSASSDGTYDTVSEDFFLMNEDGTYTYGEIVAPVMEESFPLVSISHGIYGTGRSLDEAFGLIETVEKAAQLYMLTAHLPTVNTITDAQLKAVADRFGVDYRRDFLDL